MVLEAGLTRKLPRELLLPCLVCAEEAVRRFAQRVRCARPKGARADQAAAAAAAWGPASKSKRGPQEQGPHA